jgi:hypothetical protein
MGMSLLSSGLVYVGFCIGKLRKNLYAYLRNYISRDREWCLGIDKAVEELSNVVSKVFIKLGVSEDDVVRIRIEYQIDENSKSIIFNWSTLSIEVFRKIPRKDVEAIIKNILQI